MDCKVIEYLFKEVSNLYGDPFNVKYLASSIKESGYDVNTVEDELCRRPFFADNRPDFVYLGPMTENNQELVIEKLSPYRDRIRELIDDGVVFLITGNALEIFIDSIECEDGRVIGGLGLYKLTARRRMFNRYNSLFLGEFEGMKIVGNKSQFSHSYSDSEENPFIKVIRGDGTCPGKLYEGIKDKNFMATYLLGPVLVLNPYLCENIMKRMGIENPVASFRDEAVNAYKIRLAEFESEKTELN